MEVFIRIWRICSNLEMRVINNDLIKAETLQMMLEKSAVKKEGNPYGFGWFMYGGEPNPAAVFGHSGGTKLGFLHN